MYFQWYQFIFIIGLRFKKKYSYATHYGKDSQPLFTLCYFQINVTYTSKIDIKSALEGVGLVKAK